MKAAKLKSILFTNLDYVCVNGVRTSTHALVLSSQTPLWEGEGPRYTVTGYGSSCAWLVFDIFVKSIEYTIKPLGSGSLVMLKGDGTVQPLLSGSIVQLQDGPELQLLVHDYDKPVAVQTFEIDLRVNDPERHSAFHQQVRTAVVDGVCDAWRYPAMGGAVFLPPDDMRKLLHKFN